MEQAAVCTPKLVSLLPHHLPAHSGLPKPQHKSPLPAAVLSPEAHPCGSSLDTEALALKRSERHLTPQHLPGEEQFLHPRCSACPGYVPSEALAAPSPFCSLIRWGEGSRDLFELENPGFGTAVQFPTSTAFPWAGTSTCSSPSPSPGSDHAKSRL